MRRQPTWATARSTSILLLVAVLAVGCSSSKKPAATSSAPAITAPTTSAAVPTQASTTAASSSAASNGLSGTWAGRYSGAYTGTFVLTWQQAGSALTGSIQLSAPATTLPINGTVSGGTIRFGTVGSVGITYSGTVSGHSMSGSYVVAGSGGGPWSATQS